MKKLLLIDDNAKYLKDALPFHGYEVRVASDGVQALNILSKPANKFDLILLDVMMPNMNGWETLKAIRKSELTKQTPVIMISAVSDEQKMVAGLKLGADDYIVKPFVLPNLLARMEAVLRRCEWGKNKNETKCKKMSAIDVSVLTSKEHEVLVMAAKGKSNKEIAEQLVVREVTVKTHMNNIFKKLKVTNRTQATLLALQMELVT